MQRLKLKSKNPQKGFLKMTVIIVGALVILKYAYNLDVVGFLTTGKFRAFLDYFYKLGSEGWIEYRGVLINVFDKIIYLIKTLLAKF